MQTKARILFVDDHADLRMLIQILLDRSGYAVKTAGSVAEGMALARQSPFDLYILDTHFPDGNGLELRENLRQLTPHAPVIYMTGECYDDRMIKSFQSDGDEFLLKPACPHTLNSTIEQMLHASTA